MAEEAGAMQELAMQAKVGEALFDARQIFLFGEINQDVARRTAEKLLSLSYESDDPITLYIGSPGGHVESGDTGRPRARREIAR